MEENLYKVYVKTDDAGRIICAISDAFLPDATGWVQIDEGTGDRYHHAQAHYFPLPLSDETGASNYMLEGENVRETTEAEKQAERETFAQPEPGTGSAEALLADMDTAYREGVDSV